jgi:hypothetical protein
VGTVDGSLRTVVDATNHPINSVRRDFNEVVKRPLGEGVAYDAISVGSYAHKYRRYWQNLIPGPLLHEMVEERFCDALC